MLLIQCSETNKINMAPLAEKVLFRLVLKDLLVKVSWTLCSGTFLKFL